MMMNGRATKRQPKPCDANPNNVPRKRLYSPVPKLDKISSLPESLRRHLISFLPMKDAIRVSILSKNWRNLSTCLPNLEFDENYYTELKTKNEDLDDFKVMVDQTLSLRDQSDVQRFIVRINTAPISNRHLNSWISFAVRHNVQDLTLCRTNGAIQSLPSCLFNCTTLKVLELCSVDLKFPFVIRIPLLKSLELSTVRFYDQNLTNKFLSSCCCPVLEDLSMTYCCSRDHDFSVTLSFSHLNSLKLLLNNFDLNLHMNLSVANLYISSVNGKEQQNISIPNLSSVSNARIRLLLPCSSSNDAINGFSVDYTRKILSGLHNVKKLSFEFSFVEVLTRDRELSTLLACYSLKHLQLDMHATKNQVQAITLLLRIYPNVQTLDIRCYQGASPSSNKLNMEEYWQTKDLSTRDVLKQLKEVQIRLHKGIDIELDLVRYLLGSADNLEKMSIKFFGDDENRMRISMKLLAFTRVSPNAAIFLLPH